MKVEMLFSKDPRLKRSENEAINRQRQQPGKTVINGYLILILFIVDIFSI